MPGLPASGVDGIILQFRDATVKVTRLPLEGALLIEPVLHRDGRGFFAESFRRTVAAGHGFDHDFVQENISFSTRSGTIRGLHWQTGPKAQAKLVRVNSGAILDVIVDIRRDSPTYGSQLAFTLDGLSLTQLFVPKGFAHGFCTLEPDTIVTYRVDAYFSPEHERGVRFDDPDLKIEWPVPFEHAIVSDKDRSLPFFCDVEGFV